MKRTDLKLAEWTMALGVVFGMGLFVVTFLSQDPVRREGAFQAPPIRLGAAPPHTDRRAKAICGACHAILWGTGSMQAGTAPAISRWSRAPHADERARRVCATCHQVRNTLPGQPLTRAPAIPATTKPNAWPNQPKTFPGTANVQPAQPSTSQSGPTSPDATTQPARRPSATLVALRRPQPEGAIRFNGILYQQQRLQGWITQIIGPNAGTLRRNIAIRVDNRLHPPAWVELAPMRHLHVQGCQVAVGAFVKGMVFQEVGGAGIPGVDFARTLTIQGQRCRMRDGQMQLRPIGADRE